MKNTQLSSSQNSDNKIVKVKIERGDSAQKEYFFSSTFSIGRSDDCSIKIEHGVVSRVHLEVVFDNQSWWLVDKHSSNGTFINGKKIEKEELKDASTVALGTDGPILHFTFEQSTQPVKEEPVPVQQKDDPSLTRYIKHYFDESGDDSNAGEHTKLMREAFKVVKKKQTTRYKKYLIIVGVIAVLFGAYAIYQQLKENKQKDLAENIFYDMKTLDLEISVLKEKLASTGDPEIIKALEKFDERRQQLRKNYEQLVADLGIYNLSEDEKIIVHIARLFGECELTIPKAFIDEVKIYINKWKQSKRLINALTRAKENGYVPVVVSYFAREQLPPQFFFLALQESDFREQIVGPSTRYGYAKGIWQFIPQTAQRYGLKIGPLSHQQVYDPGDERFNFPKATSAAAQYIKYIYNTDAQASGLLVMASYNWGERNIINLIRTMPENPRDRNFWNLLIKYREKIPDETYNYVFYIFSAAVICENPKIFGFDFENPLKEALQILDK
ncbi:MAG: FHA domain-containing protein [Ignavibacteriales bacterium]|nr:MAG: FHA domain-containing protein [Ignavibacteriales bacterium]